MPLRWWKPRSDASMHRPGGRDFLAGEARLLCSPLSCGARP
jgi:hypothetical protein